MSAGIGLGRNNRDAACDGWSPPLELCPFAVPVFGGRGVRDAITLKSSCVVRQINSRRLGSRRDARVGTEESGLLFDDIVKEMSSGRRPILAGMRRVAAAGAVPRRGRTGVPACRPESESSAVMALKPENADDPKCQAVQRQFTDSSWLCRNPEKRETGTSNPRRAGGAEGVEICTQAARPYHQLGYVRAAWRRASLASLGDPERA